MTLDLSRRQLAAILAAGTSPGAFAGLSLPNAAPLTRASKPGYSAPGIDVTGLPNGNFEDGLTGWGVSSTGTGAPAVIDSTPNSEITGRNSAKLVTAALNDTSTITTPVIPCGDGIPLIIIVRARSFRGVGALTIRACYYDRTGTLLSEVTVATASCLSKAFADYPVLAIPHPSSTYATVAATLGAAADAMWIDEIRLGRDRIFFQDGDYTIRSGMLRDREKLYARDLGVIGDGVTDDSDAFEAAMAYAIKQCRVLDISDLATIRTTRKLKASGRLMMVGAGFDVYNTTKQYPNTHGRGSLFFFDHCDVGIYLTNAPGTQYNCGQILRGIGTSRRQTVPAAGQTFVPVPADYDIVAENFNGDVDNIWIMNSTLGIKFINALSPRIGKIWGLATDNLLFIQNAYDALHVNLIHGVSYFSFSPELAAYLASNSVLIKLGRVDNPMFDDIFATGCFTIFQFVPYTATIPVNSGKSWSGKCGKVDADNCRHVVVVDPGADAAGMSFSLLSSFGDAIGTDANDLFLINANSCRFDITEGKFNNARGSHIRISDGTENNRVVIQNYIAGSYNGYSPPKRAAGTRGIPALYAAGSNLIVVKSYLRPGANETQYVSYPPGSGGAAIAFGNVKMTLSEGWISARTDPNGDITFNHNAGMIPDVIKVTSVEGSGFYPFACVRNGSKDATKVTVRVFDHEGGASITSSRNILMLYFEAIKTALP